MKYIAACAVLLAALGCSSLSPKIRPMDEHGFVKPAVFIDPDTGCHYWREGLHGEYLTPRRGRSGKIICEGTANMKQSDVKDA